MNFDPIHWAAAGLGVLLLLTVGIGGTAYWKQGKDLEVCESDFQAFKADTRSEGLASQLATQKREIALANAAVAIQRSLNDAIDANTKLYADNERLRKLPKGDTSRGKIVNLADAAAGISCPDSRAEFAERLERLDFGVRERLLKSRDEAIIRTIACKKYVEEIVEIINKESD